MNGFNAFVIENILLWNTLYRWCKNKEWKKFQNYFLSIYMSLKSIENTSGTDENDTKENPDICEDVIEYNDVITLNEEEINKRGHFLELNYLNLCHSSRDETLLHMVARSDNKELISFLMTIGADPSVK